MSLTLLPLVRTIEYSNTYVNLHPYLTICFRNFLLSHIFSLSKHAAWYFTRFLFLGHNSDDIRRFITIFRHFQERSISKDFLANNSQIKVIVEEYLESLNFKFVSKIGYVTPTSGRNKCRR